MTALDQLFDGDAEAWLSSLPDYQLAQVRALLGDGSAYDVAAELWLTAKPEHTAPFGAAGSASVFKDKLWDEVEKFLCGDLAYEDQRRKLSEYKGSARSYLVGAISVAVAPALGASGIFLAPAVALLLAGVGKLSLNAWCAMRKDQRAKIESTKPLQPTSDMDGIAGPK